jgi:hypothetical protein
VPINWISPGMPVSQQAVPQAVVPTGQVQVTWLMRRVRRMLANREMCILLDSYRRPDD